MTLDSQRHRLERLEGYLRVDPGNMALRAQAFDEALHAGEPARAEGHLREALQRCDADPAWRLRQAQWLLATDCLEDARVALERLGQGAAPACETRCVVAHDVAYVKLRQGDAVAARAALAPWVERVPAEVQLADALQVLWLRLLHRTGELQGAMAWAAPRWERGTLAAAAAGVASLIALDANDLECCERWSAQALEQWPRQSEALVAQASVALWRRDPACARQRIEQALRDNASDGRAWSTLGFIALIERDLLGACRHFDRALSFIPSHIGTWHGAGWTAWLRHDLAAARRCFESAIALDRNFAESHGGLATVLARTGEREAARACIDRAMRLDRSNVSARYAQALLNGEAGDAAALRRLAARLLGGRRATMGDWVLDLLPDGPDAPRT